MTDNATRALEIPSAGDGHDGRHQGPQGSIW